MKTLVPILVLFVTTSIFSQENGTIRGHIVDKATLGEGLLFAKVSLKNTDWTTQTNFHGNFEITQVAPGDYVMSISYLGYETLEFPVQVAPNKAVHLEKGLVPKTVQVPVPATSSDAVAKL